MSTNPTFLRNLKLFHSDTLECDICLDSGSGVDIIPAHLLSQFKKKGLIMKQIKSNTVLHSSDGSSKEYQQCWIITLPLSFGCWYKGIFFEGNYDYLLLGRTFMMKYIIRYTRDSIQLLDNYPENYRAVFPLDMKDDRYYVKLSINNRENLFYLDTGHCDAISLPVSEKSYAISPIHEIQDEIKTVNGSTSIVDLEEERGELRIGNIVKYGPVVYADYYKEDYWFNPARVFSDFVLDLKNNIIGFLDNA